MIETYPENEYIRESRLRRERNTALLRALATQLLPLLGEEFTLAVCQSELSESASLVQADGAGISFWFTPGNRLAIHGHWPRCTNGTGFSYCPKDEVSITVSREKTPELLAREIKRRFLPQYLAQYAEALALRRADQEYDDRKQAARARLEAAGVAFMKHSDSQAYLTGGHQVRLNGPNSVQLQLHLTLAQAERVLALLKEQ